jgi:hypothetical protein
VTTPTTTPEPAAPAGEAYVPLGRSARSRLLLAAILSATTAIEVAEREGIRWHAAIDGGHPVPDLTCGRWPRACGARAEFVVPGAPVRHRATCTRRAGHTGRHAAGSGGVVVAVWAGPR